MRQTLFVISFDAEIPLGPLGHLPVFGFGLLLAVWVVVGAGFLYIRYRELGSVKPSFFGAALWSAIALAIVAAPRQQQLEGIPIFGYGAMLLLGLIAAQWVASRRAVSVGFSENTVFDLSFWLFFSGIVGARTWFVIQYRDQFFAPGQNPLRVFYLPDGGLVFYGGMIASIVATAVYCRLHKINLLKFGDAVMPAIFVGLMFGRIGCLLNGCCWGDACDLPWAIQFPAGSVPFEAEVVRGVIFENAATTRALHPTQIYSSINALVLAILTWNYFPYRQRDGAVLAVGWLAYPISRFTIEFLRNDLGGQWGTPFTPAQLFSFAMLGSGLLFLWYIMRQPPRVPAANRAEASPPLNNSVSHAV